MQPDALSNDVINLLVEICQNDRLLIRKMYAKEHNNYYKQTDSTLDKFRDEVIASLKNSSPQYLKYFPIVSKLGTAHDRKRAEHLLSVSLDSYVAMSSLKRLRDAKTESNLDLSYKWDLTNLPLKLSNVSDIIMPIVNYLKESKLIDDFVDNVGSTRLIKNEKGQELKLLYEYQLTAPKELYSVHTSDDLSKLVPSEIAALYDPDQELQFYKKFVEKQLLAYQLQGKEYEWFKVQRIIDDDEKKRGSLIVFIDTSGSMRGLPEYFAKAIVYRLYQLCYKSRRFLTLHLFSTELKTLEVDFSLSTEEVNQQVLDFLNHTFWGGTDITQAVKSIFDLMDFRQYYYCDVIFFSDFLYKRFNFNIPTHVYDSFRKRHNRIIGVNLLKEQGAHKLKYPFDTQYHLIYNWGKSIGSEKDIINEIRTWNLDLKTFPLALLFKKG